MIEAQLAFVEVQREVRGLNAAAAGEPGLGRRPEAFNAMAVMAAVAIH